MTRMNPLLPAFGITSDAVRRRIEELIEEVDGMSKEEAFGKAIEEQARKLVKEKAPRGYNLQVMADAGLNWTVRRLALEQGKTISRFCYDILKARVKELLWEFPSIQQELEEKEC